LFLVAAVATARGKRESAIRAQNRMMGELLSRAWLFWALQRHVIMLEKIN
jgi:hypothetical protein